VYFKAFVEQTPNNGTKSELSSGKVKYRGVDWLAMLVTIKTSRMERQVRLPKGSCASDALRSLELAMTHHLVIREGRPIPSDEKLSNKDIIEVIEVFSGG
jgi:sulfur carrier protein ThiS